MHAPHMQAIIMQGCELIACFTHSLVANTVSAPKPPENLCDYLSLLKDPLCCPIVG
jgi:hypothetical protein